MKSELLDKTDNHLFYLCFILWRKQASIKKT